MSGPFGGFEGMHVWEVNTELGKKTCKHCGSEDGCATAECPKQQITEEEKERIKKQLLDFSGGKWRHYVDMRM